jgi:hypothetical protein
MHASTCTVSWTTCDLTQHRLQYGAKGGEVILQTKNTHKKHWTYTKGCPFSHIPEHGSLESLHPPEHPVTCYAQEHDKFNNSTFSMWQRRDRICTDSVIPECGRRMSLCRTKKRGCAPLTHTFSHTPHLLVFHLRWHACLWFCKGHKKILDSGIWTHKHHSNIRLVSTTNFWRLSSSACHVLFTRTYLVTYLFFYLFILGLLNKVFDSAAYMASK